MSACQSQQTISRCFDLSDNFIHKRGFSAFELWPVFFNSTLRFQPLTRDSVGPMAALTAVPDWQLPADGI